MFGDRTFSTKHYIAAVFVIFALWCAVSTAWYVCGVNNMCAIQAEAKGMTADPAGTDGIPLAATQAPLMDGYDRSGAAGEIFIMLMIAFTLGALLGRILANSGRAETASQLKLPLASEAAPRVGTPMHISEFTKHVPKPPILVATPKPEFHHAVSTPPVVRPPIIIAQRPSAPTPVIHLAASMPKPAAPSTPIAKTPERPKIKFNTSWNNPNRDPKKS